MKLYQHKHSIITFTFALFLQTLIGTHVQAAGPLTPLGAPAPSMKTLQEVEPRVLIAELPFTIDRPGSYYLIGNLTGVPGTNGLTVTGYDVTVDLGGFTLQGVPGSLDGIFLAPGSSNITVHSGTIRRWGNAGIRASFSFSQGGHFTDLKCLQNEGHGLQLSWNSIVTRCTGNRNKESGISIGSQGILKDCIANNNTLDGFSVGNGSIVERCTANQNGHSGFSTASEVVVRNCLAHENGIHGIRVFSHSQVVNNHTLFNGTSTNTGAGIRVETNATQVQGNHSIHNDFGFVIAGAGNLIIQNSAANNGNNYGGIVAGNAVGPLVTPATIGANNNPGANYDL